jgi:hypothetical protein
MNGPRSTGPEYTGKHRRDSGPGVLPPAWGRAEARGRTESYARAESDSRPGLTAASLPSRRPESVFRSEAGQRPDAG